MIRFLHTADWQIGKTFGRFDEQRRSELKAARLDAIDRIAAVALTAGARDVLVAGDVFDRETATDRELGQVMARLGKHAALKWHLLPGNHDPARAGGVWERLSALGVPETVVLHLERRPYPLADDAVLLPAPLTARASAEDPTRWFDLAETLPGVMRIGLAHGSVRGFGSSGEAAQSISLERIASARLDYLALGDWHGVMQVGERAWYPGTPEPDRFPDNAPGHVLVVTLDGPGSMPRVERHRTARFDWFTKSLDIVSAADLTAALATMISGIADAERSALLELTVTGRIPLSERLTVDAALAKFDPAVFSLEHDLTALSVLAGTGELEELGTGDLRRVAEELQQRASGGGDGESASAAHALRLLFAMHREVAGADDGAGA